MKERNIVQSNSYEKCKDIRRRSVEWADMNGDKAVRTAEPSMGGMEKLV